MGLRCLLGHDFGEPETEREREEKGEEMVVTFRTVKTCSRCGETQVVSENKEVTSIPEAIAGEDAADDTTDETAADTPGGAVAADTPDGSVAADTPDGSVTTGAVTAADDDGEVIDAESDGAVDDAVTATAADAADDEPTHPRVDDEPEAAEEFEPPQSAEEDDGIILDDADEEPTERQPGEWPDSSDVGRGDDERMPTLEEVEGGAEANAETETDAGEQESEQTPWPDQQGEDEGFAAEVGGDEEEVDVDFGNKLAPELDDTETVEEGYDAEFIGNAADAADTEPSSSTGSAGGITSAETLTREEASEVPTEYYCPDCGMTRAADRSSMRAGDICPECHHGYITERER